jgi:hypothetical protein
MLLRPPVLVRRRPLLRAAVVGGGAYMAGRAVARNQAARAEQAQVAAEQEADQNARLSALEQQAAVPTQASGGSTFDRLSQLTAMHAQGALTDAEFAAAKARLLGTSPPAARNAGAGAG